MSYPKSKLAFAVVACAGLAACGGSDNNGNGGGGGSSSGPDSQNWQTDFSNTDRYGVTVDNSLTIDPQTLAINTSASPSSEFGSQFSTPAGATVTPAGYHGAVNPGASNGNAFWQGWTYRSSNLSTNLPGSPADFHPLADNNRPSSGSNDCTSEGANDGFRDGGSVMFDGESYPVCVIDDNDLDGDITLKNDSVYVLNGTVTVGNGDVESASDPSTVSNFTLKVEAGTQIMGATGTQPSLVISRGSDIAVNGTEENPVIFGAVDFDSSKIGSGNVITSTLANLDDRGNWGSIVLSGYGEINNANEDDQAQTEAVPDATTRWYGGTDNSDDSGKIEYAIVAETGEAFRADEEVQGITIEAAGSGTLISNVQIINSDDDGIEWFGGAANVRNAVIQAPTDDALDQDLGWQGTVKKAIVIQGPDAGNRGMETDNNGDAFGATPKTRPVLANVTVLGHSGNSGDETAGALHREGYGGEVYRSVYTDNTSSVAGGGTGSAAFTEACLDVDSELDEDLTYGDVVFNCSAGALSGDDDTS